MNRRDFLKGLGAALAALVVPKVKEEKADSVAFYDYLDSIVHKVEWRNNSEKVHCTKKAELVSALDPVAHWDGNFDVATEPEIWYTEDLGETWRQGQFCSNCAECDPPEALGCLRARLIAGYDHPWCMEWEAKA